MTTKAPIKVIKRNERTQQDQPAEKAASAKKSTQESARDMVATVTGWVSEFQQKRRVETKQAFNALFSDAAPQPTKA